MQKYAVNIPEDNGYNTQPALVTNRALPHIQEKDPNATLSHNSGGNWTLNVDPDKAFVVTGILRNHYGFDVTLHA